MGVAAIAGVAYARKQIDSQPAGNHALSAVCDGEPVEGSPAYDADSGAKTLLVLDRRSGDWDDTSGKASASADLVACRSWNDEPVRTRFCEYRDGATGEQRIVEVGYHRAHLEFRAASTGKVVDEEFVTAANETCPSSDVALDDSGERRTEKFLYPTDEVEAVLATHQP